METKQQEPEKLVDPTVGRIVHFYPNSNDTAARQNGAEFIPALVIQTWTEDMANLRIFPYGNETDVLRGSVRHKDSPHWSEGMSYWVWPPIKR